MRNATILSPRMLTSCMLLPCLLLSCLLLLPACSSNTGQTANRTDADAALPQPDAGIGPVTGMPDRPGSGPVGDAVNTRDTQQESPFSANRLDTAQDAQTAAAGTGDPSGSVMPDSSVPDASVPDASLRESSLPESSVPEPNIGTANAEPTAQDALTVLGNYYAAINARQYDRAYSLWSGDGTASKQTAQQFANGYATTTSVETTLGEPGRVDAAAGSRYIQIPVSIIATRDNGDVRRYIGSYTLRRTMVDGASPEQRQWRITSADIRIVEP